jgi:CheY-like chemotaxis protein
MKTVLIIDDDARLRFLYKRLLSKSGYSPIDTSDGYETISYIKEHIRDIDVVVLDLAMPKISGIELFEVIKRNNPNAKVIVSSVFSEEQQKYFIFNADGYYDKSSGNDALLQKIEHLVSLKPSMN